MDQAVSIIDPAAKKPVVATAAAMAMVNHSRAEYLMRGVGSWLFINGHLDAFLYASRSLVSNRRFAAHWSAQDANFVWVLRL